MYTAQAREGERSVACVYVCVYVYDEYMSAYVCESVCGRAYTYV